MIQIICAYIYKYIYSNATLNSNVGKIFEKQKRGKKKKKKDEEEEKRRKKRRRRGKEGENRGAGAEAEGRIQGKDKSMQCHVTATLLLKHITQIFPSSRGVNWFHLLMLRM